MKSLTGIHVYMYNLGLLKPVQSDFYARATETRIFIINVTLTRPLGYNLSPEPTFCTI